MSVWQAAQASKARSATAEALIQARARADETQQVLNYLVKELIGAMNAGDARGRPLTVTELLRKAKVVGKFVEFFGEGTASLAVPDRATLGNMAPEYGATMGFFPVDDRTVEYFRGTGRTDEEIERLTA